MTKISSHTSLGLIPNGLKGMTGVSSVCQRNIIAGFICLLDGKFILLSGWIKEMFSLFVGRT